MKTRAVHLINDKLGMLAILCLSSGLRIATVRSVKYVDTVAVADWHDRPPNSELQLLTHYKKPM